MRSSALTVSKRVTWLLSLPLIPESAGSTLHFFQAEHLSQAWFLAQVLGLTLRTTPAGATTAGTEWERAELHNRGLADATRSFTSHLVLHRCQVLRQRARPHQPASLCTLLLGRECDYKSLCKTRAILGKRLSRKP